MSEKKIDKYNLDEQLKKASELLLKMAEDHSWNTISPEIKYVIRKVNKIQNELNLFEFRKIRKKLLMNKPILNLHVAVEQL
jgi:hypothetical protein